MYNCTYTQRTCESDRHNTRSGSPLRVKHPVVSAQCILVQLIWLTLLPRVKFTVNEWVRLARLWQWLSEAMKAPACYATMVPAVTTSCASILKTPRECFPLSFISPNFLNPLTDQSLVKKCFLLSCCEVWGVDIRTIPPNLYYCVHTWIVNLSSLSRIQRSTDSFSSESH